MMRRKTGQGGAGRSGGGRAGAVQARTAYQWGEDKGASRDGGVGMGSGVGCKLQRVTGAPLAFVDEVDGLETLDCRALEEDFPSSLGACAALDDAELQALLDSKVAKRGERNSAKGVDAEACLVVGDALERDGEWVLRERRQTQKRFKIPTDSS